MTHITTSTEKCAESRPGQLFSSYLAARLPRIEAFISDNPVRALLVGEGGRDDDLGRDLYSPIEAFTARGGKRTRPALTLLGAEAVGGDAEAALPMAVAIEQFQSAALVHDDIADEGELRRGEPCLHLTCGVGPAINMGDAALVAGFSLLLNVGNADDATRLRLLRELARMEGHTVEGQALDLAWARDGRWDLTEADYDLMATSKTAYYSAATPLAAGAIAAGGTDAQVEALRRFGMACGLAFQLQDDLLNLVGDAQAQGKDFRSDVTEGKRTLVAVRALATLSGEKRDELVGILSSHATDGRELARAVELMGECGAIDYARDRAHGLVRDARGALDGIELQAEARNTLISMADFFVERLS